jgi:hypothetical protein
MMVLEMPTKETAQPVIEKPQEEVAAVVDFDEQEEEKAIAEIMETAPMNQLEEALMPKLMEEEVSLPAVELLSKSTGKS